MMDDEPLAAGGVGAEYCIHLNEYHAVSVPSRLEARMKLNLRVFHYLFRYPRGNFIRGRGSTGAEGNTDSE